MERIEVTITEKGYTIFSIGGANILAYQMVDGVHHLIPTEEPAQSYADPRMATLAIRDVLKRNGGDVHEFSLRRNNPFLFPF